MAGSNDFDMITIEVPSMTDSVTSFVNDGKTFLIRMQWLESIGVWRFGIEDGDGNEITSAPIVPNSPLIYPVRRGGLPSGDFFVYKSGSGGLTYDNVVSGDCPLVFVSQ